MFRYRLLLPFVLFACALAIFSINLTPQNVLASTTSSEETEIAAVRLPFDQPSYKIEVDADGIYEITYDDLLEAGMPVLSVNPTKFELMHRGEAVHYSFVGDNDATFEQGEKVLFYGKAFDGSDYEKQYVSSSYYWLWADGTRSSITNVENSQGKPIASSWRAVETTGADLIFNPGYFRWTENQVNEPDAWFWQYVKSGTPETVTLNVAHPATGAGDAELTAEFLTTFRSANLHTVSFQLGQADVMSKSLFAPRTDRIVGTIPASALSNGANNVLVDVSTTSDEDYALVDQLTLAYWRDFVAIGNQLIFSTTEAASHGFEIDSMSGVSAETALVWDVTDPLNVANIELTSSDINGNSVRFERSSPDGNRSFIVTDIANVQKPLAITPYSAKTLVPNGGAEWLAISHIDFLTETNRLANYRTDVRHMTTHVVDVADVVNQYGYGYNMPESIKHYVQDAYDNWAITPEYLLLVGDATQNPQQRPCESTICFSTWDDSIKTYIPTDLTHEDRFLGLTPSDHVYAMLSGDDLLPDIAVGRIAARDATAVKTVVDKTIRYEEAVFAREAWTQNLVWLADDSDRGGNFCGANQVVRDTFTPDTLNHFELCLGNYLDFDDPTISERGPEADAAKDAVRADFFNYMNANSAGIVNYRGHGSISDWAADMITRAHVDEWQNSDRPTIILSADCLDSNFAWVEQPQSLSETFMQIDNGGSVAHWGSTGLGFTSEHSTLHSAFYDAIFDGTARRLGDATNASKIAYLATGSDVSEAFAFTLHGDPALHLSAPEYSDFTVDALSTTALSPPSSTAVYPVRIHNTGTAADTYTVTLTVGNWQVDLETMQISVPANTTKIVVLSHLVPDAVTVGETDSFVIAVESAELQVTQSLTFTTSASDYRSILPIILNNP